MNGALATVWIVAIIVTGLVIPSIVHAIADVRRTTATARAKAREERIAAGEKAAELRDYR